MHPLVKASRAALVLLVLTLVPAAGGCKGRVDRAQCDQLLARFAELVVKEKMPQADPATIKAEQDREQAEAARDDNFKNCTTEVRQDELRCAMAAPTSDAFLKCLE